MIYSVRGGRKSERLREREIDQERGRLKWMEDGGSQIRWVWGWSGVEWAGGGLIGDIEQEGEEELRKKREKRGSLG